MKAIERLYKYLEHKGIKPGTFERQINLSQGYLGKMYSRKADMGEGAILQIIENCPEINLIWLMTGEGAMLRDEQPAPTSAPAPTIVYERDPRDIELIATQRELIAALRQGYGHGGLVAAPTADYPSTAGTQHRRK